MQNKGIKFVFFGVGPLAESALYALYKNDLTPSLIITSPDKKVGRNLEIQKNIIATWCETKNIKVWQPETLKNIDSKNSPLKEIVFDVALVVSYPKILPKEILELPKHGTLNVHPSLLPKYRGPSPIQTALLNGETLTAVSIIKLNEKIDAGPILLQKEIEILDDDTNETLERKCGAEGGYMLAQILSHYLEGNLKLKEQNHSEATFTRKFNKADGEIKLEDNAIEVQNKFKAFLPHISIFFFLKHKGRELRIKISKINLDKDFAKNKLAVDIIKNVIPEGKSEMLWEDFKRGYF